MQVPIRKCRSRSFAIAIADSAPQQRLAVLHHDRKSILHPLRHHVPCSDKRLIFIQVVTSWLDGKHVVFGEVADAESLKIVKAIEATGSSSGKINYGKVPTIVDAGQQ